MKTFRTFKPVARKVNPMPAFRPSATSGLILPEELSRQRHVWTRGEWRLLERATVMLDRHGVDLLMQCRDDACRDHQLEPMRMLDGGFRLRCNHADRVMTKAF